MAERKTLRLKEYDYSKAGMYFITILTRKREEYFCKIKDGKVVLNEFGTTAERMWHEIPVHFPSLTLDEFVIMPNHIHGIIEIQDVPVGDAYMRPLREHPLRGEDRTKMTISKVIQQYKAAVSRAVRLKNDSFRWHRSFYDHIVRDEEDLLRIREYIKYNPLKWDEDDYFVERKKCPEINK